MIYHQLACDIAQELTIRGYYDNIYDLGSKARSPTLSTNVEYSDIIDTIEEVLERELGYEQRD